MNKLILVSFFAAFSIAVIAQQSSATLKRSVDSLVNSELQKQNIPGLSVVIVRDGTCDYVKG